MPFTVITITPETYFQGLARIGGYLTVLGFARYFLLLINQYFYKRSLRRRFARILDEHLYELEVNELNSRQKIKHDKDKQEKS